MNIKSPYRGLAAFEDSELDALYFFGRERDTEIVVANLIASRFTVLYGPSGVGKSSLLLAAVARKVRDLPEEPVVVVFSSWSDEPRARARRGARRARRSRRRRPARRRRRAFRRERDVYVILDQAEEYFTYHGDAGGFERALAELVNRPLRVNVLLSLREDTLARLDRLKGRIPNLFANVLRLDRLDRAAGRAAILRPLERWGSSRERTSSRRTCSSSACWTAWAPAGSSSARAASARSSRTARRVGSRRRTSSS